MDENMVQSVLKSLKKCIKDWQFIANNIEDNQEETIMAEMTKEEMERKLAEIKSAANEKASSIPKPVKYAAAAGAGVGLGYAAHKILHKGGDKAAEQVANLVSKFF